MATATSKDQLVSDRLIVLVLKALLRQFEQRIDKRCSSENKRSTEASQSQLTLWDDVE